MWILKNSKELLDHLKSPNFNLITNIKSFDFSTLYTTISHQKLKSRLATIIRNSFLHKNGNRRYKYLVLGREGPYFVKEHSDSKNKYTEEDIIKMLEFLVDNIFVVFAGKVFQQIIGIPMGTNCAPRLADIFLYSYEPEFIPNLTFYLIVQDFHRTYATGAACQQRTLTPSGHLVLSHLGFAFVHQTETTLPSCDAYRIRHIYRNLHYRIREFSTEYMQRVWHANRGRWLLRTPGPVPFWDLHVF